MDNGQLNGERATEQSLEAAGYRKYRGEALDIYYNKEVCEHVGNCVRGNAAVFEVGRRPWIMPDNASAEECMRVVDTCPTGALKYVRK